MSRRVVAALAASLFVVPAALAAHDRSQPPAAARGAKNDAVLLAQTDAGAPAADAAAPAPAAPAKLDPKKLKAPKETPELLEKGKAAYAVSCVVCHGEKGMGDGPAGAGLNPKPRDFTKDAMKQGNKPAEVFVSITEGLKDTLMIGFPQLSEEERWGLTYYVLSMQPKAAGKAKKAK